MAFAAMFLVFSSFHIFPVSSPPSSFRFLFLFLFLFRFLSLHPMAAMAGRTGLTSLPCTPVFHSHRRTPDHPPYAEMIRTAIQALAEGGGSTAAAIDSHIKSAYRDLPWGHHNLLPYYLRKLAAAGEIANTHSGRYSLDDDLCCAETAVAPPLPGITPTPPPPKSWKGQNGTPSEPNSPTTQTHQRGGDDNRLARRDLGDEPSVDVPLAMLLPGHQKCAARRNLPHLSIRILKRKVREGNRSLLQGLGGGCHTHVAAAAASTGEPVGYPVARRRGRPPKPKAAIVLKDAQKEASACHEGRQSKAKLVGITSTGDPTCSPVLKQRGRPSRRQDAIILKEGQHEAGSKRQKAQSKPKLSSISAIGDPPSFPVIERRGRPPKNGAAAMMLLGKEREVAVGHEDRQSQLMRIDSSSCGGPVGSTVINRRGRPPKPKGAPSMILPGGQQEAAAGHEEPQSERKLAASASIENTIGSTLVKRRGRPPKRKADACHEPGPAAELPEHNATTRSSDGKCGEKWRDVECCEEGTESVLRDYGGTREAATGFAGSDANATSAGQEPVLTRCGLARNEEDGRLGYEAACSRRVTRSVSANGWPRPKTTVVGQTARSENGRSTEAPADEGSHLQPKCGSPV